MTILSSRMQNALENVILAMLVLVIYLFTINPLTKNYALFALIGCAIVLGGVVVYHWFTEKGTHYSFRNSRTFKLLIFALVSAVLLWVSDTGWFFSPFFYLLYLVVISLGFLFSTSAAFSFVLVIFAILLPNMNTTNADISIITLSSLFLIIPLSYFLRLEYLHRVESEKKILILEQEHKQYKNTVDKVLSNKIVGYASTMREPLNDIRQMVLYAQQKPERTKDVYKDILASSDKALHFLKEFEEISTGKKLVKTPLPKKL